MAPRDENKFDRFAPEIGDDTANRALSQIEQMFGAVGPRGAGAGEQIPPPNSFGGTPNRNPQVQRILNNMLNFTPPQTQAPDFGNNVPQFTPGGTQNGPVNIFDPRRATPEDFAQMRSKIPDMSKVAEGEFGYPRRYDTPRRGFGAIRMPDGTSMGSQHAENLPVEAFNEPGTGRESQTYQAPDGGTYTVPQGTFDQTPEQRRFAEEQAKALGFGSADEMRRADEQAGRVRQSRERIGARRIINNLRDQGMTDEQIQNEAGLSDGMSSSEQYRRLVKLNRDRSATDAQSRNERIRTDRISNKARFTEDDEGNRIPKNQAARLLDMSETLNSPSADPTSDQSLYDNLTPSQKRELDRYRQKVAYGVASSKDESRVKRIVDDAKKDDMRNYAREAARVTIERETEKYNNALEAAQTKEEKDQIGMNMDKIRALNGQYSEQLSEYNYLEQLRVEEGLKKDQEERHSKLREELQGYFEKKNEYEREILSTGEGQPQNQVTDSGFVVGRAYTDAQGNTAVYGGKDENGNDIWAQ